MNHQPHHAKSTSELLDSAFQIYRANASGLLKQPVLLLGFMAILSAGFRLSNGDALDWSRLSPLQARLFVDGLEMLVGGSSPLASFSNNVTAAIYHLMMLVLLVSTILPLVAATVEEAPQMFPAWSGAAKTGAIVAGALLTLPLAVLSLVWADLLHDVVSMATIVSRLGQQSVMAELLVDVLASYAPLLLIGLVLVGLSVPLLLAAPAAYVERLGGRASLRRSIALSRGAFWRTGWLALLMTLIGAVIIAAPSLTLAVVNDPLGSTALPPAATDIAALLSQAAEALTLPFFIAALTMLYYDRRVRVEGYDLDVQTRRAAVPAATEHYKRATELLRQGQERAAVLALDEALRHQPNEPVILFVRAQALAHLGEHQTAMADIERALAINPREAVFLAQRGALRAQNGDHDQALADMEAALAIKPGCVPALDYIGTSRYERGDLKGSLAMLERLLTIEPTNNRALYNSACIYARQNQALPALERLAAAIQQDQSWREYARGDSDFDSIRADPQFQALVAHEQPAGAAHDEHVVV